MLQLLIFIFGADILILCSLPLRSRCNKILDQMMLFLSISKVQFNMVFVVWPPAETETER